MEKKEKTVEEQVIDVICEEMGRESACLDDRLDSDLGMDSFDIGEAMVKIENIYGINLDYLISSHNVMTVRDLVDMVKKAPSIK